MIHRSALNITQMSEFSQLQAVSELIWIMYHDDSHTPPDQIKSLKVLYVLVIFASTSFYSIYSMKNKAKMRQCLSLAIFT